MRNVLVSAYACEPLKGSEQAVGWNYVLQLARNNKVHVITRANNQDPIEENIPDDVKDNLFFHYYDTPKFILKLKNKEKGVYLYYIIWQIFVIPTIRMLVKSIKFDYSIHITFGSVWLPSTLSLFYPKFIWGPLGGGEAIPDSFINTLSVKGKLLQLLRKFLRYSVYINPIFLYSAIKAKALLCRTENTRILFPKFLQDKCYIVSDGAIEKEVFRYQCNYNTNESIQLIATSRLIHTKNVITIVRAIKLLPEYPPIKLTILGSGPDNDKIQSEIRQLGIENKVVMVPSVSRDEVLKKLSKSDVYLFASLKEACNLSLLEAMAVGLPVVCLNWTGMAVSTDDSCAFRLPVTDPKRMPQDMAKAIIKLVENPDLRRKMGESGRGRIKSVFNWEAKGQFMEDLFDKIDFK